jgi:hypothetical protein
MDRYSKFEVLRSKFEVRSFAMRIWADAFGAKRWQIASGTCAFRTTSSVRSFAMRKAKVFLIEILVKKGIEERMGSWERFEVLSSKFRDADLGWRIWGETLTDSFRDLCISHNVIGSKFRDVESGIGFELKKYARKRLSRTLNLEPRT